MFESLYDQSGKHPSRHCDLHMYWYYLKREDHSACNTYTRLLENLGVLERQSDHMEVWTFIYIISFLTYTYIWVEYFI